MTRVAVSTKISTDAIEKDQMKKRQGDSRSKVKKRDERKAAEEREGKKKGQAR